MDKKYTAFTEVYSHISRDLISTATIISNGKEYKTKLAMWDTGASFTCISNKIIQELNLQPFDEIKMYTPSGIDIRERYHVGIKLATEAVYIEDVVVADSEIDKQGLDVLIGMDIITMGDFSVSNYNGKTVFSFRFPSLEVTDYTSHYKEDD